MRPALFAYLDREQSLETMWHGFRASTFARRNYVEIDAGVVRDLLNARYYAAAQGQFISQDPSFLAVGDPKLLKQVTGLDNQAFLADPQLANSYSYGRDNPITIKDPQGNFGFIVAALPYIYAAYTAGQLGVDYYDYRNMNVTYANYTSPGQKAETQLKLGFDFGTFLLGRGFDRAGLQVTAIGLDTMLSGKDAFDTRKDNPLYNFSVRGAGSSVSLPTMNFGGSNYNYGSVISNVFSSSIQSRMNATRAFNSSLGGSGSGGSAPSNNSLWVTPSGAVVTFGGQLVAPPPTTAQSISSTKQ
jgi:RHS repeat-associated protein